MLCLTLASDFPLGEDKLTHSEAELSQCCLREGFFLMMLFKYVFFCLRDNGRQSVKVLSFLTCLPF